MDAELLASQVRRLEMRLSELEMALQVELAAKASDWRSIIAPKLTRPLLAILATVAAGVVATAKTRDPNYIFLGIGTAATIHFYANREDTH